MNANSAEVLGQIAERLNPYDAAALQLAIQALVQESYLAGVDAEKERNGEPTYQPPFEGPVETLTQEPSNEPQLKPEPIPTVKDLLIVAAVPGSRNHEGYCK